MLITAAIVIYKPDKKWLKRSISSFIEKNNFDKILFLIDNSPVPDQEIENLDNENIKYIFNGRNIGFGAAHNLGIKMSVSANADFHLILNPDVSFDSDLIIELVRYIEQNDNIGFISPKIFYPEGELQRLCKLLPNPSQLVLRRIFRKGYFFDKISHQLELRDFGYDKVADIPWLSGCFLFARTSHLQKIGGFDERFFMYMEDIDISRRSLTYGRNIFYPHVSICHVYEKGAYKSQRLNLFFILSAIRYFNKWGWIFDKERKRINRETLEKLNL